MANFIYADQPCQPDCPDRQPGCLCQKKRDWDAKKDAKKQMIRDAKQKTSRVMEVRSPKKVRTK